MTVSLRLSYLFYFQDISGRNYPARAFTEPRTIWLGFLLQPTDDTVTEVTAMGTVFSALQITFKDLSL